MRPARERIVVAFDFSDAASAALDEAIRMARQTRAELVILHVFADRKAPAEYGWKGGATQRESDQRRILDLLEREAEEARSIQALARVRVVAGDPAERILEAIASERASAIFVGADAHEGLAGALLGRVALRVVREAKIPVFVVRQRAAPSPTDKLPHRRIVAGVDFTSASFAAVEAAVTLARSTGGEVRLVHVIPAARSMDSDDLAELRARLEELASDARKRGVTATSILAFGEPAAALVAETEGSPDAIVSVGAPQRTRIARLLLGDVTQSVMRLTNSTVMVAHEGHATIPLGIAPQGDRP